MRLLRVISEFLVLQSKFCGCLGSLNNISTNPIQYGNERLISLTKMAFPFKSLSVHVSTATVKTIFASFSMLVLLSAFVKLFSFIEAY